MTQSNIPHKISNDTIADYLNGNLTIEQQQAFEAALANDPQLRNRVTLERKLKTAITASETASTAKPDFSQIAAKLENRSPSLFSRLNLNWQRQAVYAMSVAVMAIALVFTQTNQNSDDLDGQFVTLTDAPNQSIEQVLRIVATDSTALEQLIDQYQLTVAEHYPAALTIDVKASDKMSLAELAETLANQQQVNLVQLVEAQ